MAIETKSAEAKTTHESIVGSEGYKNQIEKLGEQKTDMSIKIDAEDPLY